MDPSAYTTHMQGNIPSTLSGAANVPFLGSTGDLGKTPTPFLQRGGALLTVSGLLILGGLFAQSRDMDMVKNAMLFPGLMVMGYGVARLT